MRGFHILLVGCGGTGALVARFLFQRLWVLEREKWYRPALSLILADGELVRKKNLDRQNFIEEDLGKPKARVLLDRYHAVWPIDALAVEDYLERAEDVRRLLRQRRSDQFPVVVTCVDNNRSRQVVYEAFRAEESLAWVDCGNGLKDGQVAVGLKGNGATLLPPSPEIWPEILADRDRFKSEEGCADQPSAQTMLANAMSALGVMCYLEKLFQGEEIRENWAVFDVSRVYLRSSRPPLREAMICVQGSSGPAVDRCAGS